MMFRFVLIAHDEITNEIEASDSQMKVFQLPQ